jgi:hypothetical protein
MRTENSSHVLHQPSLERDRGGEEQGVQDWAVESLASEWTGGHHKQRRLIAGLQPGQCGAPGLGAHPAAKDNRIEVVLPEFFGESFHVGRPLGQHQAAPAALQCRQHVGGYLDCARIVSDKGSVDGGYPAWHRRVRLAAVVKSCVVYLQNRCWSRDRAGEFQLGRLDSCGCVGDGVPDRAELVGDQVVELVAAVGRGG